MEHRIRAASPQRGDGLAVLSPCYWEGSALEAPEAQGTTATRPASARKDAYPEPELRTEGTSGSIRGVKRRRSLWCLAEIPLSAITHATESDFAELGSSSASTSSSSSSSSGSSSSSSANASGSSRRRQSPRRPPVVAPVNEDASPLP